MNKRNTLVIGFVIMLILNAVLIFLMFQGPKMPPHPSDPSNKGDLKERISRELELNKEQQEAYGELAKAHQVAMQLIDKKQKEVIKSYFNSLSMEEPDQNSLILSLQQIEQLESNKVKLTYQHFEELKALCNDEQIDRFKLIMKDIVEVLAGEDKNNRSPPPNGR